MKLKNLLFIPLIILSWNCQPQIDDILEGETPKLTIWGFLHPDSVATVYLGRTAAPLSKSTDRVVEDATVLLFENNILADTLKYIGQSLYKSNKGFRPKENNSYHCQASKKGFETIESQIDTMPTRPKVLRYTTQDSVRNEGYNRVAQIDLFTNKPSHYPNYGINNLTSLKWGGGRNTYIQNNQCDKADFIVSEFEFTNSACFAFNEHYKIQTDNYRFQDLKGTKVLLRLAAVTANGIDFHKKIFALKQKYVSFYDPVDAFWSPIYLPQMVKNGYGYVGCLNTTDVEIQF
jgi:Domain of unknown function (DUF4249)